MNCVTRRAMLKRFALGSAALSITGCHTIFKTQKTLTPLYEISLAQWSLHRTIFGATTSAERLRGLTGDKVVSTLRENPNYLLRGSLDTLSFPLYAKQQFGINAVEYVNTFFLGKARDKQYLTELKLRAKDAGVNNVLIMCDLEGDLGHPDNTQRTRAVENHYKWIEAAAFLGCHAIRVNAKSAGNWNEQITLAADGLHRLCTYAEQFNISILVENHGGLSSNPQWLTSVMNATDHKQIGTLPDFGNFTISETEKYDYYDGVAALMPYARAVSAKSLSFDAKGNHTTFDYEKMMNIVLRSGYSGFVGIEYEGEHLTEQQGIRYSLALLENIREKFTQNNPLIHFKGL